MADPKAQDAITPVEAPPDYKYPNSSPPSNASMEKVIENAKAATNKEQSMTLLQGIKLYPKAVMWSVLISTCIAMEGYDISLVNNFYAFPQFNRKYGQMLANGTYQVSASVCRSIPDYNFCAGVDVPPSKRMMKTDNSLVM